MIGWLASATGLEPASLVTLALICIFAGLVRGFSGFALSAIVIASAASILPPIELIPMMWWLEMTASVLMLRGGWREADRRVVFGLVIGAAVGTPVGIALTTALPVAISKLVALALVVGLAVTQLAKIRMAFLATRPGLYGSGLMAGVVTGLAGIGGMVVALYVLAQDAPSRQMRAALVLFLFLGAVTSMITYLALGVMDATATVRGLTFVPPVIAGVLLGQRLFIPRFEHIYRPFCLSLLIALAGFGILRLAL